MGDFLDEILKEILKIGKNSYNYRYEKVKAKGSFLDNKRVIVAAAPHQSGKDEYLMVLMILALDIDVCYLSAKWTMRRIPNPFIKSICVPNPKEPFRPNLRYY